MGIDIRSVVNQAYQLTGIIALDEVASGTQAQMAILKLNELIAQANEDQLLPFSRKIVTKQVSTSQNSYSIGLNGLVTADIPDVRPVYINRILYYPSVNSAPMNVQLCDLPDLITRRKTASAVGSPMYYAIDGAYPLCNIYFDIKPQQGSSFTLIYNEPIPDVTISSDAPIPPEYTGFFIAYLAKHLSVILQMPSDTQANMDALYRDASSRITKANGRSQLPILDDLMGASNYRVDNIYTGSSFR